MGKANALGKGLLVIAGGLEERRKRREEFQQKVEAAFLGKALDKAFESQKKVFDIDESGKLRELGSVPEGAQIIRDRQFSPLDQLRQGILNSQRDINQPGILEAQINQMARVPGSEQQIGSLQQQYGDSILKQQQAQAQLPLLQNQSKALQDAGLLNPSLSGYGGMDQFNFGAGSSSQVPADFPDAAQMEEGTVARDPSSGGVYQVVSGAWRRIK